MIIKCYENEKKCICRMCSFKKANNCNLGRLSEEYPNDCTPDGVTYITWQIFYKQAWKIVGEPFPKYGWRIFADSADEAIEKFKAQDELYSGQELKAYRWPERDKSFCGSYTEESK